MNKLLSSRAALLLPGAAGVVGAGAACLLVVARSEPVPGAAGAGNGPARRTGRRPGQPGPCREVDSPRQSKPGSRRTKPPPADGQAAKLPGAWPQFRGPNRDGVSRERQALLHVWAASGPAELWSINLGDGYAGAAVMNGRVYVMDYDCERKQDALRCLWLADGREIWRFAYSVSVKRNHGMSRTVPAVSDNLAVGLGPKCDVLCVDATTGQLRWGLDLVRQYRDDRSSVVRRAMSPD